MVLPDDEVYEGKGQCCSERSDAVNTVVKWMQCCSKCSGTMAQQMHGEHCVVVNAVVQ